MTSGIMEFSGWVTMSWNDPRLAWNMSNANYTGVKQTYYKAQPFARVGSEVWTPDLELYNGFRSFTEFVPKPVVAYLNGNVWFSPMAMCGGRHKE